MGSRRRRIVVAVAAAVVLVAGVGAVVVRGGDDRPVTRVAAAGGSGAVAGRSDAGAVLGLDEVGDDLLPAPVAEPTTSTSPPSSVVLPPLPRPDRPPTTPPGGVGLPPTPGVPGSTTVPPIGGSTTTSAPPPPGLHTTIRTDRAAYAEDQPVDLTVEVCNTSTTTHSTSVHRGQDVAVTINDREGRAVASWVPASSGREVDEWAPQQCRRYGPYRWWQEWHHFDGTRGHGYLQPSAGRYTAHATYSGVGAPVTSGVGAFDLEGVTVDVSTDRRSYGAGEPVIATVRVCNPFDRPQTQTIVWDPQAVIRIFRDGHTIAQVHENGPIEPRPLVFAPRQCLDHRYVWDQRAEVWDPGSSDGTPSGGRVPTGTYAVEVIWWGHDHDRGGKGHDARPGVVPERVPFDLR